MKLFKLPLSVGQRLTDPEIPDKGSLTYFAEIDCAAF
jgi:hypothetical protein